ncbi:MAG: DUF2007 domain-containing protein [Betaproteobacteria bacterium]|nr:DUF2007 domain-containing protein [Betaproteobacteria bacterium]
MKQVHVAKHAPEAHLIRGFLESQGIEAVVRGEYLTSGWGELPVDLCSVWVVDEAQFERANELLVDFLKGGFARKFSGERWTCPQCGERLEGQFTACWNCGTTRK